MGVEGELNKNSDNKIEKPSDYSIYDYFYDKPAVLLTIATVLVSLLSFVFSLLVSAYRNQLLSYWGLDYYSKPGNTIGFSVFTAIFVFGLVFCLCNYLATASSDAFVFNTFFFLGLRIRNGAIKKSVIETKTLLQNSKKRTKNSDDWNKRKQEIELQLNDIKITKRMINKFYYSRSVYEFVKTFFCSVAIMWSSFILLTKMLPVYIEIKKTAFPLLCYSLFYNFLILVLEVSFNMFFQRAELKKQLSVEREEDYIEAYNRFPFVQLRNFRFRKFFKNSNIAAFFRNCFVSLLGVLVVFVFLSELGISERTTFDIASINGHQVAVIFKDDKGYYGNRVIIMGDVAYISMNEHEMFAGEGCFYKTYSFSKIVRVEKLDDVSDSFETTDDTELPPDLNSKN